MKCLYTKNRYVALQSTLEWQEEYGSETVYYGEIPDEEITTIPYNELNNHRVTHYKVNLFRKKEYKKYSNWFSYIDINVYPGDALLKKVTYDKIEECPFNYLSQKMKAQDFIEYLKDNGLNTCPIMK